MKGRLRVARLAGIDVFVHWSFPLLLVALFAANLSSSGAMHAVKSLALVVSLFVCVVLHELGHSLTARRYGIPTRDITLYPFGGVARLGRMPRRAGQEIAIALAGPAVNFVIAALLFPFVLAVPGGNPAGVLTLEAPFVESLMWLNLAIGLFNLLPAFPMDGGRVLRASLTRRMSHVDATQNAAEIGQTVAMALVLVGLMLNWMLCIVGVLVFLSARAEAFQARLLDVAANATVRDVMLTDFVTLNPGDSLDDAAQMLLSGSQTEFPVVDHDHVVGLITRDALLEAIPQSDGTDCVESIAQCDVGTVWEMERLEDSLEAFGMEQAAAIPVVDTRGQLVGLLTRDNFAEWAAIAMGREKRGSQGRARRAGRTVETVQSS